MNTRNQPRNFLALRENWQADAGLRGRGSEVDFANVVNGICAADGFQHYTPYPKPKHLRNLYGPQKQWGVEPDFAIENTATGRIIFVEIKRQHAAGNAHERACKFFAPGLVVAARKIGNIRNEHYPYFWVFTNGIAEDEKYVAGISFWFSTPIAEKHFLLWDKNPITLLDFFQHNIRPVLD